MLLELLMQDERREGRKEGRKEGLKATIEMLQMVLSKFRQLPDSLLETLYEQEDIEVIKNWMEIALRAESLDDFISKM